MNTKRNPSGDEMSTDPSYNSPSVERGDMGETDENEVRRDEDGDPIATGTSVTKGSFEDDELEEELIRK